MKNKKGMSVIIGYVLLISFAIVLGIIVYQWMKTYVPSEELNCPEGVSIFLKDYSYDCDTEMLTIYIKNTGKFDLGGYFIYATTSPKATLATKDLSLNNTNENVKNLLPIIKFVGEGNSLSPDEEEISEYNLTGINQIYSIEILPIRWQIEKNKRVLASCKNIKIKEVVVCKGLSTGECIPAPDPTLSGICGVGAECGFAPNGTCGYVSCGSSCPNGEHCDASYQCVTSDCVGGLNVCSGRECGTVQNGTCGFVSCGTCESGETCNSTGQCILNCGNGVLDLGEQCDDGNINSGDGCSSTCTIESGWTCSGEPSECEGGGSGGTVDSCPTWCAAQPLYDDGTCRQNQAQCTNYCSGGTIEPGGAAFGDCTSPTTRCCCCP